MQITHAEHFYQRPFGAVQLLAVSKGHSDQSILEAVQSGQHHFGENYVQEALAKISALRDFPLIWHFIGRIQSNKCKEIAEYFSWVHTVCRADIAHKLHQARPAHLPPLNVCIQVNLANESGKSGVNIADLYALIQTIKTLPRLKLRGLMLIPPILNNPADQYALFSELHHCMQNISDNDLSLDTLSMGMSHDFIEAIHAGSTMVRVGRAIFGERVNS